MAKIINGAFFGHVNETFAISIGVGSGAGAYTWQEGDYLVVTIMDDGGEALYSKPCQIDVDNERAVFTMGKEDARLLPAGTYHWMIEAVTADNVMPASHFVRPFYLAMSGKGDENGA
jgi:hypothetical protein